MVREGLIKIILQEMEDGNCDAAAAADASVGAAACAGGGAAAAAATAAPATRTLGGQGNTPAAASSMQSFQAQSGFFQQTAVGAAAGNLVLPPMDADVQRRQAEASADFELTAFRAVARSGIMPTQVSAVDAKGQPCERRTNPLKDFWLPRRYLFPYMALLARRTLCVPATSAASERLFSVAGLTVTAKRNRLNDSTVSLLVYLRSAWSAVKNWRSQDCSSQR